MFRPFIALLLFSSTANTIAASDLCPVNNCETQQKIKQVQPSADDYRKAMEASVKSAIEHYDWVIDDSATSLCGGYYQTPFNPNPEKNLNAEDAHTQISAGHLAKGSDGFTEMSGDVEFFQGSRSFRCDNLRYSETEEYTELNGNIILREKGILLISDQAVIDGKKQSSQFNNTRFLLAENQLRGESESMKGQAGEQEQLNLENASFTLCPPNQESWSIAAAEIKLDIDKGWGQSKHTVFKVRDVPILYIPYFDFPIDDRRKSGFLWPSISGGSEGIDITIPYYLNLAPNYDMTYQGRYFHEHGYQHGIETRYKNRWSQWQLGGTYINNDKKIGDEATKNNDQLDSERWLGFITEDGQLNSYWSTFIDYTSVSDIEYFRDWGTKGLDIKKSLNIERTAGINFNSENWLVKTRVVDYQSLEIDSNTGKVIDDKYQLLPQVLASYSAVKKPFELSPLLFSQYSHFTHDTLPEAQRLFSEVGFNFPMSNRAFSSSIKLSAKTLNYQYSSDNNEITDVNNKGEQLTGSEAVAVATASWDNRLFFQRDFSIGDNSFNQTLTPRLFYYYAENKDQSDLIKFDTVYSEFSYNQVFSEERFSGYDRISDANKLSVGISSNIFNQNNPQQNLFLGIGQTFYFEDRNIAINETDKDLLVIAATDSKDLIKQKETINRHINKQFYRDSSDIAGNIFWQYDKHHGIYSDAIYDPYANNIQTVGLAYHYETSQQRMLNLSYRYSKDNVNLNNKSLYPAINPDIRGILYTDIEQAGLSFYSPVSLHWSLFAASNYDINKKENIENLVGFKYGSCCWSVLFAWQEERKNFSGGSRLDDSDDAEYQRNWYIQFELTGLGSVSKSITRLLEESIEGFNRRDRFN